MISYDEFIRSKSIFAPPAGINPSQVVLNANLFDFQRDIVSYALQRGKYSIFAGTGLGKSLMELSWADAVRQYTRGKVLIFTPLAVAAQMCREGAKFGIECSHVHAQTDDPIQVTNYQKMDYFDLSSFDGVILDESSILKNQQGHFRNRLIEECKKVKYRLAATATPSPNDYMELGNHAEFCGIMSYTDMLSTFFVHDGSSTQNWRLKGHAEAKFWEWMATWSVMLSNPSDLGYDGAQYNLPPLHQLQHTVDVDYGPCFETGTLFPMQAQSMSERLGARRATINDRCEKAAEIVAEKPHDAWVVWCNLNDESELLNSLIPDSVQIVGSMAEDKKEAILDGFANGSIRVLISKPSLTGFGMNWQHCSNTVFVGLNDSFEQIYQAMRRFYRFGQKSEVYAHFIASELEGAVVSNIKRKEAQALHMMQQMVKYTADLSQKNIRGAVRDTLDYNPNEAMAIPSFLTTSEE